MSEEKKDLLPCPFCGSSAMLEELGDHHGAYHNLGCSKRECPAHHVIYTESEAPVEDSVNWWNTRAALQEIEAWTNLRIPPNAKRIEIKCFDCDGFEIGIGEGAGIETTGYLSPPEVQESEAGAVAEVRYSSHPFKDQIITWTNSTVPPVLGDKLYLAPQYAQAIETAAIMKCAEVADAQYQRDKPLQEAGGQDNSDGYVTGYVEGCGDCGHAIRALIRQDGRTQLEEFGMKVAESVDDYAGGDKYKDTESLRAIVSSLIGAAK